MKKQPIYLFMLFISFIGFFAFIFVLMEGVGFYHQKGSLYEFFFPGKYWGKRAVEIKYLLAEIDSDLNSLAELADKFNKCGHIDHLEILRIFHDNCSGKCSKEMRFAKENDIYRDTNLTESEKSKQLLTDTLFLLRDQRKQKSDELIYAEKEAHKYSKRANGAQQ